MTTTLIYKQTCEICEKISNASLKILMTIWSFGETVGRAKAAAELHRQGYHKEAKALMLESK
jgi:hypothetical protein